MYKEFRLVKGSILDGLGENKNESRLLSYKKVWITFKDRTFECRTRK